MRPYTFCCESPSRVFEPFGDSVEEPIMVFLIPILIRLSNQPVFEGTFLGLA